MTTALRRTRAVALASRMRSLQARIEPRLVFVLRDYFRGLARRVVAAYLVDEAKTWQTKAQTADRLVTNAEIHRLMLLLQPYLTEMIVQSSDLAGEMVGVDGLVASDPKLIALLSQSAQRVVGITEETRRIIQETLATGSERGYSPYQIAHGVEADGYRGLDGVVAPTYRGRADTIARTEMAYSAQESAHNRYRAAGVTMVDISDGPECLIIGTEVYTPHGQPLSVFSRRYDGEVIVLRTAIGEKLTCTPNHPILTRFGWVYAKDLREGDEVIRHRRTERIERFPEADDDDVPTAIEKIAGPFVPVRRGVQTRRSFHGDGSEGEVYVERAFGSLGYRIDPTFSEPSEDQFFIQSHTALRLSRSGTLTKFFRRARRVTYRIVSRRRSPRAFVRALMTRRKDIGLAGRTDRPSQVAEAPQQITSADLGAHNFGRTLSGKVSVVKGTQDLRHCLSVFGHLPVKTQTLSGIMVSQSKSPSSESLPDSAWCDIVSGRDILDTFAGEIEPIRLIEVSRRSYSGHVFNLKTSIGWFVASSIITHNCGWTSHDDPDLADGSTRTLEEAEAYPIAHPGCRRITLPRLDSRS